MVKRAKSPDLVEDARYLVVWQPFPLNANWQLPDHCLEFLYWVASVLGSYDHILAIHHKPSARSTVIVEIEKQAKHNGLLGEHRWAEVLKRPSKEDRERVSRVYYCIYRTTREAQKDGWKRINVEAEWFIKWDPEEGSVVHFPLVKAWY
ncbi:hypothetical protein CC2G_008939 [Coprinopsis cinerea AmutBmut pab1-1]|nr:hypothetical protein CC2G_008939 [Coprinopsis cinerea AmutBmut pab1-1]